MVGIAAGPHLLDGVCPSQDPELPRVHSVLWTVLRKAPVDSQVRMGPLRGHSSSLHPYSVLWNWKTRVSDESYCFGAGELWDKDRETARQRVSETEIQGEVPPSAIVLTYQQESRARYQFMDKYNKSSPRFSPFEQTTQKTNRPNLKKEKHEKC